MLRKVDVPGGSLVENALLHLEAVRVGPERVVVRAEVFEVEVDEDVLAPFIFDADAVQLNVDLDSLGETRKITHVDHGCLIRPK